MTTTVYATSVHLDEDTVQVFEIPALLQQAGYTVTGSTSVVSISYVDRSGQLVNAPTELLQMLDGDTLRISASGWPDWFGSITSFTLVLDSGTVRVPLQLQVVIDPVNDAPSGADKTISLPDGSAYVLKEADFGFVDRVEGDAFKSVLISDPPAVGQLLLNGVRVTAGTEVRIEDVRAGLLSYLPPADASGVSVFGFQVRDAGGTTGTGAADLDPTPNYISFCIPTSVVGDRVWLDANGNGVQDAGEAGLANVAVTLVGAGRDGVFGTADDTSASTVTNASGNYQFAGVQAGRYELHVGTPGAYVFTGRDLGGNDALDSDVGANGVSQVVTLTAGRTDLTLDAGVRAVNASTLNGTSWIDANRNGVRDAGEAGQAGVAVTVRGAGLDGVFGTADDTVTTTVTGVGGGFSVAGLANGSYKVGFGAPAGYGFTAQDAGTNDAVDSDVDAAGQSAVVTLGVAQGATIDAGLLALNTASIGDRVWHDANANGLQDAGETGIAGIAVTLAGAGADRVFGTADDTSAVTTTDSSGAYNFGGLAAGQYKVVFVQRAGLTFTTRDVGTNDAVDSDADLVTGSSQVVTLAAQQVVTDVDAGYRQTKNSSIGNKVWRDANADGLQQAGESAAVGVSVQLRGAGLDDVFGTADDVVASTTTNAYGNYAFTGLGAGRYQLTFGTLAGYTYTTKGAGTDATLDSDAGANGQTDVFTLAANSSITHIDAGLTAIRTASIGDRVWLDANGNGRQDAGEAGLGGVAITLTGAGEDGLQGTVDDVRLTTVSGADGQYGFSQLAAGTYSVSFATPAGFAITTANAVDDALDSDIDGYGRATLTLATGQVGGVDAGYQQVKTSSLSGRAWNDANGDGIRDIGETLVPGTSVTLRGAGFDNVFGTADDVTASAATDGYGIYRFANLAAGSYTVSVAQPAGYVFTQKDALGNTQDALDSDVNAAGTTDAFTLGSAAARTDIDAGLSEVAAASIGDRVWLDANGNGLQDTGEVGIGGVQVTLTGAGADRVMGTADDILRTATTDAAGGYAFNGLKSGSYTVAFATPAGLSITAANLGANDAIDSDIDSYGRASVVLTPGQAGGVDAGYQQVKTSVLASKVWNDVNDNGLQDATETGVAGVTVILRGAGYDNVFGTADDVTLTTTTDGYGGYRFASLAGGNYTLNVGQPAGYVFTQKDALGNTQDALDSDVNAGGSTDVFTLGTAATRSDVAAGLSEVAGASIGDRVWLDANGNGLQDAGEVGIAGVQVTLTGAGADRVLGTADDLVRTATTDASGGYTFNGLKSGSYTVAFATPAGLSITAANQGANDAIDSDIDGYGRASVVLTAGQAGGVDAGYQQVKTSVLASKVWNDVNDNGLQDSAEAGVAGATVTLRGAGFDKVFGTADDVTLSTTTDAAGNYRFSNLAGGDYTLSVTQPAGYVFTQKDALGNTRDTVDSDVNADGSTDVFTLGTATTRSDIAAGVSEVPSAVVGDRVWLDANGNGLQDTGEVGLAGVQVKLVGVGADGVLGTADDSVRLTTTDANGSYRFDAVESGSYRVEVQAAGFKATLANAGADNIDSDIDATGRATITVAPGGVDLTVDAGLQQVKTASVGDRVWADANGNGLQDAGEAGQGGVTVTLRGAGFDNVFGTADDVSATTTSGADGSYAFGNLAAGQYTLNFSRAGYKITVADANGNNSDTLDSDVNPVTGSTAVFSLGVGQVRTDIDAGVIPPPCASIVGSSSLYEGACASYQVKLTTAMSYDTVYYVSAGGGTAGRTLAWAGNQTIAAGGGTDSGGCYYANQYFDETGCLRTATGPANMSWDYALHGTDGAIVGQAGGFYVTVKAGETTSAAFSVDAWCEKVYVDGDFLYGGYGFKDACNVNRTDYQESAVEWFNLNLAGVTTGEVQVCTPSVAVSICDTSTYFRYSPIVLDLDGNGIHTTALAESTGSFDLLGTGKAVASGWIAAGDAFLAVDANGNGRIDDIGELFGGRKGDGFAKLATFDGNGDGVVDAQDTGFAQLRVWQDGNGNHVTDAGELHTLAEAGIASLNTAFVDQSIEQLGNLLGEAGLAHRADGTALDMVDVYFNVAPQTAEEMSVAAGALPAEPLLDAGNALLDAAFCGGGEGAAAAQAPAQALAAWAEAGEATRQLIASMRLAETGLVASVA